MKKLRIRGITGTPFIFTRLRGRIDGKRGAVALRGDTWSGHYIENKLTICRAFVSSTYRQLEKQTALFRKESTALVMQYRDIKDRQKKPEQAPKSSVPSIQARYTARMEEETKQLSARELETKIRLADIEERIIHADGETETIQREAEYLTAKRIQAYLQGAAYATRKLPDSAGYSVSVGSEDKKEYVDRHKDSDAARRYVIRSE